MSMKRNLSIAAVLVLASLVVAVAHADSRGTWTASRSSSSPDVLHLNLMHGRGKINGASVPLTAFTGLSLNATNANFQLRREAGTFSFDGAFRDETGAGHYTFTPNRDYFTKIRSAGVRNLGTVGDADDEALASLALFDVSSDYIRSMAAAGYDEPFSHYTSMRIFKVTPELVRELASLGFRNVPYDDLIASRVHKVTPDYIRAMHAVGYKLSMEQLVATRIHKATPDFLLQMRDAGYKNLDYDDLIAFRIHGVSPEFVRDLASLGYRNVDANDLVAMRIHGVTPEYIRQLASSGYKGIPVEKLISMRIHGIDADDVRRMK
jgi:hypothetical protein